MSVKDALSLLSVWSVTKKIVRFMSFTEGMTVSCTPISIESGRTIYLSALVETDQPQEPFRVAVSTSGMQGHIRHGRRPVSCIHLH